MIKPNSPDWQPESVQRSDLVQNVSTHLRTEIINGTFPPLSNLPSESSLAESFGVSRRVIREALRVLSVQGLVEISQGKKTKVKPNNTAALFDTFHVTMSRAQYSLLDLYELRKPIEIESTILAATRAKEEDIAKIEEAMNDFDRFSESGKIGQYDLRMKADFNFHQQIAKAAHNSAIDIVYEMLNQLFHEYYKENKDFMLQMIKNNVKTGRHSSLNQHKQILQAIQDQDPEEARKAATNHLERSIYVVVLESQAESKI